MERVDSIYNGILSFGGAKANVNPRSTHRKFQSPDIHRVSGLFYSHRCLTDFHLNQKNVIFQHQEQAPVTHKTCDFSGLTNNVAEGNQNGTASHSEISPLKDLNLIHGENHTKQPLWNYEYPALNRACLTLHSLTN